MADAGSSVGVFTVDRDLVVRSWDAWLGEATGLAAADACGRPLSELFPDVEERGMAARLRHVCELGAVEVLAPAFHHYLIACPPRAESAHFAHMQQHVTLSPLREGDRISGAVVTIEDVTPRLDRERVLAAELHSHDEAIRHRAAQVLADGGHTSTLAGALGDESWRVRRTVAHGMARTGGEDAIALLVQVIRERHRDLAALNAAITGLAATGADAVPAVVELLAAADVDVRTYAALTLGLLGDARAVPPLLDAIADADPNVRYHAIEALGRIGSPAAADAIAAIAESRDFSLAFVALDALGILGDPLVAPRLLPLLDDELLAGPAAECLGRVGGEEVVTPLAAALSRDATPAASVAVALASIHDRLEEAFGVGALVADLARAGIDTVGVRRLVAAVSRGTDAELPAFARVLGWLPYDGIDALLASLLRHAGARAAAADILPARGSGGIDALTAALRHEDVEVRRVAAAALGRAGTQRAVAPLTAMLAGPPDEAIVAAGALGAIGDARAFEPLVALLDAPDASVRQAAVAALDSIAHPALHDRVLELLADPSPRRRECAARMAGYFGAPAHLARMLALCEDAEPHVRRAALEHIVFFDDPCVAATLRDAMAAGDATTRAAAARALAQLDDADARALLLRALDDDDLWVRYFAARSLARHSSADADLIERLKRLAANDPVPPVRAAAVEALGALNAVRAEPLLESIATMAESDVALAAIEALGALRGTAGVPSLLRLARGTTGDRRLRAMEALLRHPVPEATGVARTLAASGDAALRTLALRLLAAIGDEAAVAAIVELVDVAPRRDLVRALSELPDPTCLPVRQALAHPDAAVRRVVVEGLARSRHPRAARVLVTALDDDSPHVRLEAARGLGRLDLGNSDNALVAVAEADDNPAVRMVAWRALTRGRRVQLR